ncbi:MAG TPA: glutamate racemase [Thiothrix sp.]|nr:glutamate racemase [Thiothrix sp.]
MPQRAIGVFDSGLGGLSVLREIHHQLPYERLIYVADSAYAPYGDKPTDTILQRCDIITRFFLTQNIKAMVIACNTATAVAANHLRQRYPHLHIIAIEPAIKPATKLTQKACIGVFATQQTIQSQRLQQLIEQHANHVQVVKQACSGLVEMVEQGRFADAEVRALLQRYLQPIHQANVDVLVLGCTHYPFLHQTIQQLSPHLRIIEPSVAVTRQLNQRLLDQALHAPTVTRPAGVTFYTSKQQAITKQYAVLQHLWYAHALSHHKACHSQPIAQSTHSASALSSALGKSTKSSIHLLALPTAFC